MISVSDLAKDAARGVLARASSRESEEKKYRKMHKLLLKKLTPHMRKCEDASEVFYCKTEAINAAWKVFADASKSRNRSLITQKVKGFVVLDLIERVIEQLDTAGAASVMCSFTM